MSLLKWIPLVSLFKIPYGENTTADALAKLAKVLSSIRDDSISIEVHSHRVLSQIDMESITNRKSDNFHIFAIGDEELDCR